MRRCILSSLIWASCLGVTLGASGCTTYLESRTPDGFVPPPPVASSRIKPAPAKLALGQSVQPAAPANASNRVNDVPHTNLTVHKEPKKLSAEIKSHALKKFDKEYRRVGRPRIVVFFNRKLSDQVMEWRSDERLVQTRGMRGQIQWGGQTNTFESSAYATQAREQRIGRTNRPGPGEKWMWRFEETFAGSLMDHGVRIIDRATILRLEAAKHRVGNVPGVGPSVTNLEIIALKGRADILIEVLIARDASSSVGYRFRAIAKEVNTGRVLASTSSLNWEDELVRVDQQIVATSQGYQRQTTKTFPSLPTVTRFLAEKLMVKMAAAWQGQTTKYSKGSRSTGRTAPTSPTQTAIPSSVKRAKSKGPF